MTTDLEEVKKMVVNRPGFVSVGVGPDSLGRESIVVIIERRNQIEFVDLPTSVGSHLVRIAYSDKIRALKRNGKVDWKPVFR